MNQIEGTYEDRLKKRNDEDTALKSRLITQNYKMTKIFDFVIPKNVVAIKSVQVSALCSGQMNLLMNFVGEYDQMSQNIIVNKDGRSTDKALFKEKYDNNSKGL
jgi:hypothetical protein